MFFDNVFFYTYFKNNIFKGSDSLVSNSWSYDDLKEIQKRRYLLKDVGLELFLVFGHTYLLAFNDTKVRHL